MAYTCLGFAPMHQVNVMKSMVYLGGGAFLSSKEPPWLAPAAVSRAENGGEFARDFEVKNKQRPGQVPAGKRVGRMTTTAELTEGVGVRTLCPHHMSLETITQEAHHAQDNET